MAAADNVARLDAQLLGETSPWLEDGAAAIFREHFLEALRQAGVARVPTILDAANRRTALGLAINWGLRFLIATAAGLSGVEIDDPAAREIVAAVSPRVSSA